MFAPFRSASAALGLLALVAALEPVGCAHGQSGQGVPDAPTPAAQQQRLAVFRQQGAKASLAVLPTLLAGKPNRDVGDAVGLVLEQQGGLEAVASAAGTFAPPAGTAPAALPALLQAHLRAEPSGGGHTLLTAFEVEQRSFVAVRSWLVDRDGELVWSDVQRKGDAEFDRLAPREPMQCCMVVAERVRALLGLERPAAEHDGPMKQLWAAKSSLPAPAELEAMAPRLAALRALGAKAKVAIFPVRLGAAGDAARATALAQALAGSCAATAVDRAVAIDLEPTSNEQLRLWTVAKAFRAHLEQQPVAADYALLADYLTSPDHTQVGAVHFILCTAQGEWVAADFQNEHHGDFAAVAPKDLAGCDELVKRRLARLLQ